MSSPARERCGAWVRLGYRTQPTTYCQKPATHRLVTGPEIVQMTGCQKHCERMAQHFESSSIEPLEIERA